MDGFLKKYSKIIACVVGLALLAGGGIALRYTFSAQTQKPYIAPTSIHLDPATIPYEVTGKIITLKRLGYEHLEDYNAMFSDDTRKGFNFWEHENYELTQNYVYHLINRMNTGEMMAYAIFDNSDNCFIGQVEVRAYHEEDPGQIGSWLNEKYRGKGRIQEAIKLLVNTYLKISGQPRVNVFIETFNKRSYRAFQKAGFKQVGRAFMSGKKFNILDISKNDKALS